MKKKEFILNILSCILPSVLVFPVCIWGLYQVDKASYDCFFVVGPSMSPTLTGDPNNSIYGYSDKSQGAIDNLQRFDMVICYYPFSTSQDYQQPYVKGKGVLTENATKKIKRVIGLPGDFLLIDNEIFTIKYTVNGQEVVETYGADNLKVPFERLGPIENREAAIKLGENEYFVMGDNWTKAGSSDCCNPTLDTAPHCIYKENIDGVIFKLSGTCTYGSLKHCNKCKSIVDEAANKCSCGSTEFKYYDDIIEERPYEDGPKYLK